MIALTIILGLLPSFAWLLLFLKEDIHPEPKKIIAKAFFAGVVFAAIALIFELIAQYLNISLTIGKNSFFDFLWLSILEEVLKLGAAYMVIRKSPFFDEPMDAMIYIITAALGFAALENLAVITNVFLEPTFPLKNQIWQEALGVTVIRFSGATLLHSLSSGVLGYYWAKGIIKKKVGLLVAQGVVIASLLHAIFNYLIMELKAFTIYPIIFLIIVAVFVFWDFEKIKKSANNE